MFFKKRKISQKYPKNNIKTTKYGEIMRIFFLILIGFFSGIFAGMGMGGGTFLVPLLALIFHINQVFCQSTNVLCFLGLAIVCFVIYTIKKLIDFRVVLCVGLPATIIAGLACIFSLKIQSHVLKIIFGCFIILVGIFMFFTNIFQKKKTDEK